MLHLKNLSFVLVLFTLLGCTKLPEVESSSKINYLVNGKLVESFYTNNVLVIESSKKGRNTIILDSYSEAGNFGFTVVSDSIVGNYTYTNSFPDDYSNRIHFVPSAANSWGYNSGNCPTPEFLISINAWYPGQQTISGTFAGTVCDEDGNMIEITNGAFEYVKRFD